MKISLKTSRKFISGISLLVSFACTMGWANAEISKSSNKTAIDSSLSIEIKRQLADNKLSLHYPNSVKRFYRGANFISPWNKQQSESGIAWQAMMLIDCVLQYGLCHDDYHPQELTYPVLHDILEKPGEVSIKKQARFDIMLTDAMLNIINNLHFGKLNPDFPAIKIDNSLIGFRADQTLTKALTIAGLKRTICDAQPKSKAYADMQYQMYLLTGLYSGDCYEIPESKVRKLAINMERLRWRGADTGSRIEINIPAYTLNLFERDSCYSFKVIVGKPEAPSALLRSHIGYFTASPQLKAHNKKTGNKLSPIVITTGYSENTQYALHDKFRRVQPLRDGNTTNSFIFWFSNKNAESIHDTSKIQLFKEEVRDFSRGCILVEHAENLSALLLKYDNNSKKMDLLQNAIAGHKTQGFNLNKPVPVNITYLTNEVKKGQLIDYKDIYNLDDRLEMAMYNKTQDLALK